MDGINPSQRVRSKAWGSLRLPPATIGAIWFAAADADSWAILGSWFSCAGAALQRRRGCRGLTCPGIGCIGDCVRGRVTIWWVEMSRAESWCKSCRMIDLRPAAKQWQWLCKSRVMREICWNWAWWCLVTTRFTCRWGAGHWPKLTARWLVKRMKRRLWSLACGTPCGTRGVGPLRHCSCEPHEIPQVFLTEWMHWTAAASGSKSERDNTAFQAKKPQRQRGSWQECPSCFE